MNSDVSPPFPDSGDLVFVCPHYLDLKTGASTREWEGLYLSIPYCIDPGDGQPIIESRWIFACPACDAMREKSDLNPDTIFQIIGAAILWE